MGSEQSTPNGETVREALESVYGQGSMVTALAEHLVDKWTTFQAEEADGWHSVEHSVRLTIWNWFPGGSTAELAAAKVMGALGGRGR